MKISIKIYLLTFVLLSCEDIGKNFNWNNEIEQTFYRKFGNIGYDYGWSASHSPYDDGIVIVGSNEYSIEGDRDLFALKTDKRGYLDFEKTFGGGKNDEGYDVISTSDGGFLFVGYSWSFGNEQQVYAVKVDFHGNKLWEKSYGGAMWDVGQSVIELNQGGYIIAGFTNSPGLSSGNTDKLLLKIDSFGNQIWIKTYGNNDYPNHEWAYDVIEHNDSSLIIVGARDRYNEGKKNILITRVSNEGILIWEKEIISSEQTDEIAYSITKDIYNKYYICVGKNSIENIDIYIPEIIKIDGYGNVDWKRTFYSKSKDYHHFRAESTKNGDILLVGSSFEDSMLGFKSDAFITRINSYGEIIWTNAFGTSDGDDWGWKVFEKPNGNIVMVGSTKSYNASLFDVYLVGINNINDK